MLQLNQSRLLLSRLGDDQASLYAVPTDKGQVCEIFTEGPIGCAGPQNFQSAHVNPGIFDAIVGRGTPAAVYGLALDDVTGVTVIDSVGARNEAVLENNAFFAQMSDSTAWPATLVAQLRDGSTQTLDVSAGGPPTPAP